MRLEFFGGSMERNEPLLSQATYATGFLRASACLSLRPIWEPRLK